MKLQFSRSLHDVRSFLARAKGGAPSGLPLCASLRLLEGRRKRLHFYGALALAAACSGGETTDGTYTPTVAPPTYGPRCADLGPDASVTPLAEPVIGAFEGFDLLTYFPDDLRGVAFYFYGGNDVSEWLGYEQIALMNQLAVQGIGYVVTDRTTKGSSWDSNTDDVTRNEDLARLVRLRDDLIATTALQESTPIVSTGFSDGAAMSVHFATTMRSQLGWPIEVVLVHNSGAAGVTRPDLPIWVTASQNDTDSTRQNAQRLYDNHVEEGYTAAFRLVEERTLQAGLFRRNPDWDERKSIEAINDLVLVGLIDEQGTRLVTDEQIDVALSQYVQNSLMRGSAIVSERTRVLWATHRYNAFYAAEECAFALDALGY